MKNKDQAGTSIHVGSDVSINPDKDKSREVRIRGIVKDILTRDLSHPHGPKVRLVSGEIGRIKEIYDNNDPVKVEEGALGLSSVESDVSSTLMAGEGHFVEFKTSLLWSKRLSSQDIQKSSSPEVKRYGRRASTLVMAKTIAGFSNADGGQIVIGVKESKPVGELEVVGIESEFGKLADQNTDGYRRTIVDDVVRKLLPDFVLHRINDHLKIYFDELDSHIVCRLQVLASKKPVFLRIEGRDHFFVRIDASTREIHGSAIVDYCKNRFG